MKQTLLLIAALAMVGCAATPYATGKPFTNTLGMKFVLVPGTDVQFCIWETRGKDYAAFATANAGVDASWKSPEVLGTSIKQTDTHPVVNVSWEDANTFCAWLTRKERAAGKITANQRYRLPTDAEWSTAVGLARETGNTPEAKGMGVKDVYPWGNTWPPPKGAGNYYGDLNVDNFKYSSPVGSFAANAQCLHDLGGNVWEWYEDWYDPTACCRPTATTARPLVASTLPVFGVCWWVVPVGEVGFVTFSLDPLNLSA